MSEPIWCHNHSGMTISQICLNPECAKESLMCAQCSEENHEGHPFVSLAKFRQTIQKYLCNEFQLDRIRLAQTRGQQELTKEGQLAYAKMQNFLEQASQSIYKQSQKLNKLAQFMENLNETLLNLSDLGEETELSYQILSKLFWQIKDQIDELDKHRDADIGSLNEMFSNLFLLLQAVRMPDPETGKMELTLTPSQVSQIRTKAILDRKADFTQEMKQCVESQDSQFETFLKALGQLIKDNKQFLVPKNTPSEEQRNIEFGKKELGPYYQKLQQQQQLRRDVKNEEIDKFAQSSENFPSVEKCGIQRLDEGQAPTDVKKQMFKLCNYLIFYNTLMCEAILPEPILRGVPMKKMQSGELKFPVRCAFCRLLKIRSFVSFYFRFDLVSRFGKLCLFRDSAGKEICAHEMCLLWSNRVTVDHTTSQVDVISIFQAIHYAQALMCRYCGSIGASLKCNRAECNVFFHFNCLKQVKLMGLQLDHEQRFRFFCEDHVRHNYQGQSDWFITRIRMKHIIQQGGQPAFTKRHNQIDWSNKDQHQDLDSSEEPSIQKH